VVLLSNVMNICASAAFLVGSAATMTDIGPRLLVALSVMFSCICVLLYFEFSPKYYVCSPACFVAGKLIRGRS